MKILVDTSVWSIALRRKTETHKEAPVVRELEELLLDSRVAIIGIIRQELLSGISDTTVFDRLKKRLAILDDEEVISADHILAAQYHNTCRAKGVQGSAIDFLICAVATRNDWAVFTADKDFQNYQKHIPIELYTSSRRE
jgi:predicted nucleic acid-binding protein